MSSLWPQSASVRLRLSSILLCFSIFGMILSEVADLQFHLTPFTAFLGLAAVSTIVVVCVLELGVLRGIRSLNTSLKTLSAGRSLPEENLNSISDLAQTAREMENLVTYTAELRRSNEELSRFAYIAAHDLRAPLRAIQNLTDWIESDAENQLTSQSIENLSLLSQRAIFLNQLVGDMLRYSQASPIHDPQRSNKFKSFNIGAFTHELSTTLTHDQNFDISYVGDVETIDIHGQPLRQILLNLVTNAVKHHDQKQGKIIIGARRQKSMIEISVQDDGPGIKVCQQGKLFGPVPVTQRPNGSDNNGLGLQIVRNLVARIGGKLTCVSDPRYSRGTRFTVTMPVSNND